MAAINRAGLAVHSNPYENTRMRKKEKIFRCLYGWVTDEGKRRLEWKERKANLKFIERILLFFIMTKSLMAQYYIELVFFSLWIHASIQTKPIHIGKLFSFDRRERRYRGTLLSPSLSFSHSLSSSPFTFPIFLLRHDDNDDDDISYHPSIRFLEGKDWNWK